jgi:predicted RNase H-like HicB family nuclease
LEKGRAASIVGLAMAENAIRLVIEDCIARGEPIPTPQMPRIREITVTLAA